MLVVDDFLDAREMYAEYFAFSGFRVVEASNGAEAVQKALELIPHVILMDLSMPGMDGWEATRRLKADRRTKHIPVIALTGHALTGYAESAKQAGCDAFVTKPCLPDTLVGRGPAGARGAEHQARPSKGSITCLSLERVARPVGGKPPTVRSSARRAEETQRAVRRSAPKPSRAAQPRA